MTLLTSSAGPLLTPRLPSRPGPAPASSFAAPALPRMGRPAHA
ncbi:hypothetical protein [Streptomyces sp. NBC_01171]|nr:hypothetical protein OG448_04345 [Streptomyces sp. NBC_01171]